MHSICGDSALAAADTLEAALEGVIRLDCDSLTTPERLVLLERLEQVRRLLPVAEYALINQLREQAAPVELGGSLAHGLANRLRITRSEATRRIHEAQDLGDRRALTGEPLPPRLPATAAAQRAGQLGAGHISVIRAFFQQLPCCVDAATQQRAEAHLAGLAAQYRPDQLRTLADKLADCLNPDGNFSEQDRARRRALTLGKQDADGMSQLRAWLSPAARAALEAVLAKLAAPGMADPYSEHPVLDGPPSQQAIDADTRTPAQRNHDGLHARAARNRRVGKTGPAQRAARFDHRHDHTGRVGGGQR
ncbi:hypothetical protein MBOT_36500 [Mycobacterium botniense]|uniref:DUF222 domain-containing protein n=1 Tax=Mycobacterium botniense TaxID=84962 RepID=A0A7I9Y2I3_9MYCO|nr:hypothetical protein MBOT_36500 [Mycobacterium botniense]